MTWTGGSKQLDRSRAGALRLYPALDFFNGKALCEMKMTIRKDKAVLGKKEFEITHYEPELSAEERMERMRFMQRELYLIFRDIESRKKKNQKDSKID